MWLRSALAQTAAFAALGRPLYGNGSGVNMLYRIVHSEPELSLLPEPLRPLFARCLAADPAERATPAEVVEWCRQRLGADDTDADVAPPVWRESGGSEVVVPPPVADHTLAQPQQQPLIGYAQPSTGYPGQTLVRQKGSGWRTALITVAGVVGGALVLATLGWGLTDALRQDDHRNAAGSSTSATAPAAGASASARGSAPDSSDSASDLADSSDSSDSAAPGSGERAGDGTAGTSSSSASPQEPVAEPYPQISLDAKQSVNLKDPRAKAKGDPGDIRFG